MQRCSLLIPLAIYLFLIGCAAEPNNPVDRAPAVRVENERNEAVSAIRRLQLLGYTTAKEPRVVAVLEAWTRKHPDDVEALYHLGVAYRLERAGPARTGESWRLIERAAKAKPPYPAALADVAHFIHCKNTGRPADTKAVYNALAEASESNDPLTWWYVGATYFPKGPEDVERIKAVDHWLTRAHDAGCIAASVQLAMLRGYQGRVADAVALLRRASEAGSPPAMAALARLYADGTHVTRDVEKSLALVRSAASVDYDDALLGLAQYLTAGTGTPIDLKGAAAAYRRLAELGNLDGMHGYADCLLRGRGVDVDVDAALRLLNEAANSEHVPSMELLAATLIERTNDADRLTRARALLLRCKELGSVTAEEALKRLEDQARGDGDGRKN